MRRILAVLLVAVFLVASAAPPAHAGGHHGPARAVIDLAAFAILAPFIIVGEVLALTVPRVVAPAPVSYPPASVYQAPAPVYYAPQPSYSVPPAYVHQVYTAPAPAQQRVIQYPHGRYVLQGDGVATAYQWVWIPNPPIPPPPPPAPPAGSQ